MDYLLPTKGFDNHEDSNRGLLCVPTAYILPLLVTAGCCSVIFVDIPPISRDEGGERCFSGATPIYVHSAGCGNEMFRYIVSKQKKNNLSAYTRLTCKVAQVLN